MRERRGNERELGRKGGRGELRSKIRVGKEGVRGAMRGFVPRQEVVRERLRS